MENPQQNPGEPQEIDPKAELKKAVINLSNLLFQIEMQKAIVAKLKELAR